jgi:voltage-gated potassium channel
MSDGSKGSLKDLLSSIFEGMLKVSPARLLIIMGVLIILAALGVGLFERHHSREFDSVFNVFYWLIVTSTTTGYGDIIPITNIGKGLNIILMLLSLVFVAILTAAVASWLVERRLMEGKGMKEVNLKNHLVICGWNANAPKVLDAIFRHQAEPHYEKAIKDVVLLNELPEEQITEVLYAYRRFKLKFVRGDFSHESVLQRANIRQASMLLILADGSIQTFYARSDERALLAALAARSLNPGIRIAAELVDPANYSHLKRAGVDPIVMFGAYHDFLLSHAVTAPGLAHAVQDLLDLAAGPMFRQTPVPGNLVDQEFKAACEYLRDKNRALVVGVISEEEYGVGLEDILSEDMSAVDMFIKKQFEGLEDDYFIKGKKVQVHLNPLDSYRLKRDDRLVYIAQSTPAKEVFKV